MKLLSTYYTIGEIASLIDCWALEEESMEKVKIASYYLKHYLVWLFVNFFICILPILITLTIRETVTDDIFLAVVSYSITLLLGSLYLQDKLDFRSSSTSWVSLGYILPALLLYAGLQWLPATNTLVEFIKSNMQQTLISVFILTIFLSFLLNASMIHGRIRFDISTMKVNPIISPEIEEDELLKGVNN